MRISWDNVGEHLFKAGVDHGVFYKHITGGAYRFGVPWNGLTGITPEDSGTEMTALYSEDRRSELTFGQAEFGGKINCYTYPDELYECMGYGNIADGIVADNQERSMFGFSYRVKKGSDTDRNDAGYELHLVYGAYIKSFGSDYQSLGSETSPAAFSFDFACVPESYSNGRRISHVIINSTTCNKNVLKSLETALYGTDSSEPYLPLPDEIFNLGTIAGTITFTDIATPRTATVSLSLGGEVVETVEVTVPDIQVDYSFTNLLLFDDDGEPLAYEIKVEDYTGYTREEDYENVVYVRDGQGSEDSTPDANSTEY